MNLYLIRADSTCYDSYDSAVVVAKNAKQARSLHPSGNQTRWGSCGTWPSDPKDVAVVQVGKTHYKRPRVLVASFNAG